MTAVQEVVREIKKIYEILDKGGSFDVYLQKIDDYLKQYYDGRKENESLLPLLERFSQEEQRGFRQGGRTFAAAELLMGRNARTSGVVQETQDERNDRQETEVEAWAKANGVWMENADEELEQKYGKPFSNGQESRVYRKDANTVVKSKNTLQYYDLQGALDSIALHNSLFPETAIKVTGFGKDAEGGFVMIIEQPFVKGVPLTQKEITDYAKKLGFEQENDGFESHYKNDQTLLHDLHEGNVVKDDEGNIFGFFNERPKKDMPLVILERRDQAEGLINVLRSIDNGVLRELISQIYEKDNNYIEMILTDGTIIKTDNNVDKNKYKILEDLYSELIKESKIEYIDLRFDDFIVKKVGG